MTQLSGRVLVYKDDPRIRLRGEIDLLIAELLKAQLRADQLGVKQLVDDLEDVYRFVKALSSAEVNDAPFAMDTVIGLDYGQIREVSHHPKKYFGREHLFNISYREGELTILLNTLRAISRKAEILFYEAFKEEDGSVPRKDLMEGFNRLSSVLYILCLRSATAFYDRQA
jgi:ethanolamine utilization cobalamin adenosyltransferase